MGYLLTARHLRKTYAHNGKTVEAVKSLDLSIRPGEILGFLGPNGAGKTTTLRMLATLLLPDAGEATVAGFDLVKEASRVRTRIGYVSQAGGSDRNATGFENLALQGQLYGMTRREAYQRSESLLAAFNLTGIAGRKAETYSGGQRRRLDVALGMVHTPELLFLDEPTTGLDPQNRSDMWQEIRRLKAEGVTIFLTTHYMDEADVLSDRIAIMDHGEIVTEGTSEELKKRISGDTVLLGFEDGGSIARVQPLLGSLSFVTALHPAPGGIRLFVADGERVLPEILRLLDREQAGLKTVSLARPTLDDVFLKETGRALEAL